MKATQQWLDEAERRLAAYRRGDTNTHPGEEVFESFLNRACWLCIASPRRRETNLPSEYRFTPLNILVWARSLQLKFAAFAA